MLFTFDIDYNFKIHALTILCKQSQYDGKDRKKENYHGFICIYIKILIRCSCDHHFLLLDFIVSFEN